ncbi:MAG: maleylpyruvate isomerase family mycothiol-dependent enzyme [Acidimicrobiales bacterium]
MRRASGALVALLQHSDPEHWSAQAGELDWTIAEVLAHLADVCGFYAVHLAVRSPRRLRFDVTLHASANPADQVTTVAALAEHLARTIAAAPLDARAWHHDGMADTAGFAAMATDELLVHAADIAEPLGIAFQPEPDICRRVLARLFPWAPSRSGAWATLLWANGRIALPGHARLGPDWAWASAPLTEWDGERAIRRDPPDEYEWDPAVARWVPHGDRP